MTGDSRTVGQGSELVAARLDRVRKLASSVDGTARELLAAAGRLRSLSGELERHTARDEAA